MEELIEKVFEQYPYAEFIHIDRDKSISIMRAGDELGWNETIKDFASLDELRTHLNE